MDAVFKLLIVALWFPQIVGQLSNWLCWLQVKEYRVDRFFVFLKTSDGRKNLKLSFVVLKIILISLSIFVYEFIWLALFVFLILDIELFISLVKRSIRKPVFTERIRKMSVISLLALVFGILIIYLESAYFYRLILLISEIVFFPVLYLGIFITNIIVEKVKFREIKSARKRLEKVKPFVIGVTGSYGKTTTKDFIAHFLSSKYKVAKTEGNQNTEFGVARGVIKNVNRNTEFFVAEMGAYKKGEIKKLASIVEPQIGVITGVEPQHLSLFGSLDDIKKAKFESIEALPKNGIAIFNLSNKYCRKLAERAKKLGLKVLTYYRKKDKEKENADIVVEPILVNEDGIEFEIYFAKGKREIFAPLHGVHFLENLACAILVARHFRISWKEIESACKTIETPESTMRIYKAGKGIIIDDSYNNTPHGFLAAVEYLKYFKGYRKYVITSGIIELGKEEGRVHRKLAGKMSREVDKIILTKSDARVALESGLEKNKNKLKLVRGSDQILKFIQSFSNSKCVILLEGRMPSVVSEYVHELSKDSKNVS